jgi:hypothetical protein
MIQIQKVRGIVMSTEQDQLVENSIRQIERCGSLFAEHFAREMDELTSSAAPVRAQIRVDPLEFMQRARDRYRAIESCEISAAVTLLPNAEQFNLAANAMLGALTKTLGSDFNPGTRQAWISALRLIAERTRTAREVA